MEIFVSARKKVLSEDTVDVVRKPARAIGGDAEFLHDIATQYQSCVCLLLEKSSVSWLSTCLPLQRPLTKMADELEQIPQVIFTKTPNPASTNRSPWSVLNWSAPPSVPPAQL